MGYWFESSTGSAGLNGKDDTVKVPCTKCGRDHDLLAAQMVRVIGAFQAGELHVVNKDAEIVSKCILSATLPGTGRKTRNV